MKTVRCVRCRAEFTDEEIENATACPTCGSKGRPMSIPKDTTVKINPHELRILTMWAMNYAESCDKKDPSSDMVEVVKGIVHGLRPQVDVPLTMDEEFGEVAQRFGEIEVIQDGTSRIIKPPVKN